MSNRPTWDETFLAVAAIMSRRAVCTRRRVGAVLVKGDPPRIISAGYNGTPSGHKHCGEGGCPRGELSYEQLPPGSNYGGDHPCKAVHAEANVFLFAGERAKGGVLYVTDEPCSQCTTLIYNSGVVRVVTPNRVWGTGNGP